MELYGFADLQTVIRLKKQAGQPDTEEEDTERDFLRSIIVMSPDGGIAGYDNYEDPNEDDEIPSAMCKAYLLYGSGTQVKLRKAMANGSQLEVRVANLSPGPIAEKRLGRGTSVLGGALLVDWLPCS